MVAPASHKPASACGQSKEGRRGALWRVPRLLVALFASSSHLWGLVLETTRETAPSVPGSGLGTAIGTHTHRSVDLTDVAQSLHRSSGVYASYEEDLFQLVKRDGRRELYDPAKLTRSLTRAGVAPYMLAGILDAVDPRPGMDTNSLRRRVECELALRQPRAARRYTTTRTLTARTSQQSGYGWACMNPADFTRLSLRPGDTIWLNHGGAAAPFSVQNLEDVECGHVWLNLREMAAMEASDGTKLAATGAANEAWPPSAEAQVGGRADVTGLSPGRNASGRRSPESLSGHPDSSQRRTAAAGGVSGKRASTPISEAYRNEKQAQPRHVPW